MILTLQQRSTLDDLMFSMDLREDERCKLTEFIEGLQTARFDHEKILLAYVRTVLACEGVTYATNQARPMDGTACDALSRAEQAELERLDDKARAIEKSLRLEKLGSDGEP